MSVRDGDGNDGNADLHGHGKDSPFEILEVSVVRAGALRKGHERHAALEPCDALLEGSELGAAVLSVYEDMFSPHKLLSYTGHFPQLPLGDEFEHRIDGRAEQGNVEPARVIGGVQDRPPLLRHVLPPEPLRKTVAHPQKHPAPDFSQPVEMHAVRIPSHRLRDHLVRVQRQSPHGTGQDGRRQHAEPEEIHLPSAEGERGTDAAGTRREDVVRGIVRGAEGGDEDFRVDDRGGAVRRTAGAGGREVGCVGMDAFDSGRGDEEGDEEGRGRFGHRFPFAEASHRLHFLRSNLLGTVLFIVLSSIVAVGFWSSFPRKCPDRLPDKSCGWVR
mmetsp:Transcript_8426/g.18484  ORF Transcript_8426/g.18484 Transcript_8426/m.18484 type:complete len:330 (-) Transcript_8426:309-1298(-)